MILAVQLGPGPMGSRVHLQRLVIVPEGAQVRGQAAGGHQSMQVIWTQQLRLLFKDALVQLPGFPESRQASAECC